jgi:hypothetical protein
MTARAPAPSRAPGKRDIFQRSAARRHAPAPSGTLRRSDDGSGLPRGRMAVKMVASWEMRARGEL